MNPGNGLASEFYIFIGDANTIKSQTLDEKHLVIGRVITGLSIAADLEKLVTSQLWSDQTVDKNRVKRAKWAPPVAVKIVDAGEAADWDPTKGGSYQNLTRRKTLRKRDAARRATGADGVPGAERRSSTGERRGSAAGEGKVMTDRVGDKEWADHQKRQRRKSGPSKTTTIECAAACHMSHS